MSGAIVGAILLILLGTRELLEASGGPVAVRRAQQLWPVTRILLVLFVLLMLDRMVGILAPGV